jgi:hypothetical protein
VAYGCRGVLQCTWCVCTCVMCLCFNMCTWVQVCIGV